MTEFRGQRQLNGPDYILLDGADWNEEMEAFAGAFIPVYPSAAKIPTWVIARCVRVVLDTVQMPPDPMPSPIRAERKLIDLPTALREIHRPSSGEMLALAKKRLAWDEAFAIQLTLVRRKQEAAQWPAVARPQVEGGLLTAFDAGLPFQLTEGQEEVGAQISADLATPHPMHRLLQGEVGAGKTLVALRAMLQVMDNGGQTALLAPTEVLAAQHFRGITESSSARGAASGGAADRLHRGGGEAAACWPTSATGPPRWSSAPMPCSTRASTSPTSASSSSTSSTASGSSSATPCAPRPSSRRTFWS